MSYNQVYHPDKEPEQKKKFQAILLGQSIILEFLKKYLMAIDFQNSIENSQELGHLLIRIRFNCVFRTMLTTIPGS